MLLSCTCPGILVDTRALAGAVSERPASFSYTEGNRHITCAQLLHTSECGDCVTSLAQDCPSPSTSTTTPSLRRIAAAEAIPSDFPFLSSLLKDKKLGVPLLARPSRGKHSLCARGGCSCPRPFGTRLVNLMDGEFDS